MISISEGDNWCVSFLSRNVNGAFVGVNQGLWNCFLISSFRHYTIIPVSEVTGEFGKVIAHTSIYMLFLFAICLFRNVTSHLLRSKMSMILALFGTATSAPRTWRRWCVLPIVVTWSFPRSEESQRTSLISVIVQCCSCQFIILVEFVLQYMSLSYYITFFGGGGGVLRKKMVTAQFSLKKTISSSWKEEQHPLKDPQYKAAVWGRKRLYLL